MMRKTLKLIDPDTENPIELDFPHAIGSFNHLSDSYQCVVQVDVAFAFLFNFEHLQDMSAFESTALLEYAAEEFKLAFAMDSQQGSANGLYSVCDALLEWANLYPYGVWSVT